MKTSLKWRLGLFLLATSFIFSDFALAVNPPEPQSGGRFFNEKGTRSSEAYRYLGRTSYDSFDSNQYAEGLQLGVLEVQPYVGYMGQYDSNVFMTQKARKADYVSRLPWGINTILPIQGGQHLLTAGVNSVSEWFADQRKQDHTDWDFNAGSEFNFRTFSLALNEDFKNTQQRAGTELTQLVQRYENRLTGLLTIPFAKFFTETEADYFILRFPESANADNNRQEFTVYPRIGIDIGKRTQGLLEYGFTEIYYQNQESRRGTANQASAGVRGFLGKGDLVSYQAWGGWQIREYNGDVKGFNNFVGRGEVRYAPTVLTQLLLRVVRQPLESVMTDANFYVQNDINLRYRRQLSEKLFANVRGGVGLNDYSTSRQDFLWEPGAGLEYFLPGKIFALFGEYRFSGRNSNTSNEDYYRHLVSFGIKAQA